jgi:hypothetical protein
VSYKNDLDEPNGSFETCVLIENVGRAYNRGQEIWAALPHSNIV